MGKRTKAEAAAAEQASAKPQDEDSSPNPAAEPFCGICGKDIDTRDEYLASE